MPTLRNVVDAWLKGTGRECVGSEAALSWMEAYGTDYARAWRECPRADVLVLMGAALGADAGHFLDFACSRAQSAMGEAPTIVAWPREALDRASSWRDACPPITQEDAAISDAILANADAVLRRIRLARAPSASLGEELRPLVIEALSESPLLDPVYRATKACAAVARALQITPSLVAQHDRYLELCHTLALAHLTGAASACLVGASVSGWLNARGPSARVGRNVMLIEAFHAVHHLVEARARFRCACPVTWRMAILSAMTGLIAEVALEADGREAPEQHEPHTCLERAFGVAVGEVHLEVAQALRAAIPMEAILAKPSRTDAPGGESGARVYRLFPRRVGAPRRNRLGR